MNKGQLTWKPQGLKPRKSAGVNTQPQPLFQIWGPQLLAESRDLVWAAQPQVTPLTSLYLSDLVF